MIARGAASLLLVASASVGAFVQPKLPEWRDVRPAPRGEVVRPIDPGRALLLADAELLAAVAKSEDPHAATAVMWTVLNRVEGRASDVLGAATSGAYHGMTRHGDPRRRWTNVLDRQQFARLRVVALDVLEGRRPDPTAGATHFHRIGSPTPAWAPDPRLWRTFGEHAFYRLEKKGLRGIAK